MALKAAAMSDLDAWLREVAALQTLRHPNIVKYLVVNPNPNPNPNPNQVSLALGLGSVVALDRLGLGLP